jgi:hypothetical protein
VNLIRSYFRELFTTLWRGWLAFWFTPTDTATLGVIRICTGAMLFYTHLVWSLDLEAFFGRDAWLSPAALDAFYGPGSAAWSYLSWIESTSVLWTVHIAALVVFFLLTIGYQSRVTSVLAWLATVAYCNRSPASLFGLDQINGLLAMYLMIGPCGASYSIDRWLARRKAGRPLPPATSVSANVAIRLIQVHMCIIYLFAGLSKLSGPSWWNGYAIWLSVANLEYQSIDMTWLADYPQLISLLTHVSVMWEVSYMFLVWPRLTRPLWIAMAIPLHLGIAVCLGMITFGLIMLVGNLAFVSPALVRTFLNGLSRRSERAGEQNPATRPSRPAKNTSAAHV